MKLKGKRVLVTGGAGFIGSNLVHSLVRYGVDVTVVDAFVPDTGGSFSNIKDLAMQSVIQLISEDLRDEHASYRNLSDIDVVFNLAGKISHQDSMLFPKQDMEHNLEAHLNLLEWCRSLGSKPKIIYTSTRQVYGRPQYLPVDEKHPVCPVDINGIHKFATEEYHRLYAKVYGMHTTVLRLTNTFGPRQNITSPKHGVVGWFLNRILKNKPIELFDGGVQLRDFSYVDDVVNALMYAAEVDLQPGSTYNIAGTRLSLAAFAEKLIKTHGSGELKTAKFPENRRSIDLGGDYFGTSSLFEQNTGWKMSEDLDSQIAETISYFKDYRPNE